MRRVAELHRERAGELAKAINEEMGKALAAAEGEVNFSADIYQFYADRAEQFLADEEIELLGGGGRALLRRQPVGALLGIMPWNYPVYQVARFAAPNLVLGNTIVLKHAAQCPRSAALQAAIFADAGLPEGAFVNVYATNDQIADVIADRRIQGVSLTGSERAGSIVGELAGRHLKKCVLELGGADPFVLLSTDDLDGAVDDALSARTGNVGQACNGAKRFVVVDGLYDDFVAMLHDRVAASAEGAPLSSLAAAEGLAAQVDAAVAAGAHLVAFGRAQRRLPPGRRTHRRRPRQPGLPPGVLRSGRDGLPRRGRGRRDPDRQRHALRPRVLRLHDGPRAGRPRRQRPRGRHGLRQRRRHGSGGAALRRCPTVRLRPRARPAWASRSS